MVGPSPFAAGLHVQLSGGLRLRSSSHLILHARKPDFNLRHKSARLAHPSVRNTQVDVGGRRRTTAHASGFLTYGQHSGSVK